MLVPPPVSTLEQHMSKSSVTEVQTGISKAKQDMNTDTDM